MGCRKNTRKHSTRVQPGGAGPAYTRQHSKKQRRCHLVLCVCNDKVLSASRGRRSRSLNNGLPGSLAERDWKASVQPDRDVLGTLHNEPHAVNTAENWLRNTCAKTRSSGKNSRRKALRCDRLHLLLDFVILGAKPGSGRPSPGKHTQKQRQAL